MSFTVQAETLPTALQSYQGEVLYLDFWASWCSPCAQSFPWLNQLQARYGKRLRVVGVGVDEQPKAADKFLKKHPAQFTLLADPQGALAKHYAISGMPSAVLLAADGRVLYRHSGFKQAEIPRYEANIAAALPARP